MAYRFQGKERPNALARTEPAAIPSDFGFREGWFSHNLAAKLFRSGFHDLGKQSQVHQSFRQVTPRASHYELCRIDRGIVLGCGLSTSDVRELVKIISNSKGGGAEGDFSRRVVFWLSAATIFSRKRVQPINITE
jgi:hypothetical protein